jgi:hypothetical protein
MRERLYFKSETSVFQFGIVFKWSGQVAFFSLSSFKSVAQGAFENCASLAVIDGANSIGNRLILSTDPSMILCLLVEVSTVIFKIY